MMRLFAADIYDVIIVKKLTLQWYTEFIRRVPEGSRVLAAADAQVCSVTGRPVLLCGGGSLQLSGGMVPPASAARSPRGSGQEAGMSGPTPRATESTGSPSRTRARRAKCAQSSRAEPRE